VVPVEQSENAKPDDEEAGTELDLTLPGDERGQQRKGKQDQEDGQQMTDSERTQCRREGTRIFLHQPG
jgi:hypothetical protein